MLSFIITLFSILVLVNIYLYVSGLRLRKKLLTITKKIADEEIAYEIKKLETAFILEAYDCLKRVTFQERFVPGIGSTPSYKPVSVDEGYIIQKSFVSFVVKSIRDINKKHKTDIKLNIIDGDFSLTFSQSLEVVKILLLLAEKNIRKEMHSTSVFILAHGPLQFSIETEKKENHRPGFDFLLQDQLMNSTAFHIIGHQHCGAVERFVIGVSDYDCNE